MKEFIYNISFSVTLHGIIVVEMKLTIGFCFSVLMHPMFDIGRQKIKLFSLFA